MPPSVTKAMHGVFSKRGGVLLYVCRTTVASTLVTWICAAPFVTRYHESHTPDGTLAWWVVLSLLAAPLLENLFMIGLAEFMDTLGWPIRRIVIAIAVVFAAGHAAGGPAGGIAAFFGFATMTITYHVWRDRSFEQRYFITVLQHALLNVVPVAAFIALDR